ncbi:TnsA-like heteromeric transposase endonuclease subunit [Streptomyces sp. G7(2002)]|uniref:TnsA-like heteromeric transposase endonuclease subunit n=1 Tax=Streptomyces sp. G7(2002) TaxID=2971798 RepID=UPI00237D9365|nr:TnsA-like heteromeric transposase endonuclease subunit [Streptomyces sp. G7(2002)]WDT54083.1 TnsA-like heteromeric transposase endonuclease subunit [Streptomyces sp. G7(2002)]
MKETVRAPEIESRPAWSHSCALDDLVAPYAIDPAVTEGLDTEPGWARRWTARWKTAQADVISPVQDLTSVPAIASVPVRGFTWRAGQRHRPGLQYLLATGRMHGFESLAERNLLMALDFVGNVVEVLSQPFKLRFTTVDGSEDHTPDFLVLSPDSAMLIDVRPGHLVKDNDLVKFAATEWAASAVGWRYLVASGWRRQVLTSLDALSARRRPMSDRLGLRGELLELLRERPRRFGELAEATSLPAVARAHAVHLLWHRRLAMDLAKPLDDASWIYPVGRAS